MVQRCLLVLALYLSKAISAKAVISFLLTRAGPEQDNWPLHFWPRRPTTIGHTTHQCTILAVPLNVRTFKMSSKCCGQVDQCAQPPLTDSVVIRDGRGVYNLHTQVEVEVFVKEKAFLELKV